MDMLDFGIYLAYLLFFVAAGSMFVLPLINIIKHPKSLGKSALGIGSLAGLFVLAFLISGDQLTPKWESLGVTTEFSSRMIGAGLTMFYFVFVIAIITMIYSEISKALK